jgi:shikimate dehydrogenase
LEPLLAEAPASVIIANRTVEKAELLAELFADLGPVSASGFDWLKEPVDLIINATSASLSGDVPPIAASLIEPGKTFCYDMMYGKEPTSFCRWAREHGAARRAGGRSVLPVARSTPGYRAGAGRTAPPAGAVNCGEGCLP